MATQLNQPLSKSMSAIAMINTWAAKIACSSTCGSIIHRSRISYFIIYCSLYPRYNICGVMVLSRDPCILFSDKGFRWIDNYFAMDISPDISLFESERGISHYKVGPYGHNVHPMLFTIMHAIWYKYFSVSLSYNTSDPRLNFIVLGTDRAWFGTIW